jgi:hypothetical protein
VWLTAVAARTAQDLAILEEHDAEVSALALSPDGRSLYSGSSDRTVRRWRTDTCKLVATWEMHSGEINALTVAHDGQSIFFGTSDRGLRQWRVGDEADEKAPAAPKSARPHRADPDPSAEHEPPRGSLCVWRTAPLRLSCQGAVARGLRADPDTRELLKHLGAAVE